MPYDLQTDRQGVRDFRDIRRQLGNTSASGQKGRRDVGRRRLVEIRETIPANDYNKYPLEIVLVNGGSFDRTGKTIDVINVSGRQITASDSSPVRLIAKNCGGIGWCIAPARQQRDQNYFSFGFIPEWYHQLDARFTGFSWSANNLFPHSVLFSPNHNSTSDEADYLAALNDEAWGYTLNEDTSELFGHRRLDALLLGSPGSSRPSDPDDGTFDEFFEFGCYLPALNSAADDAVQSFLATGGQLLICTPTQGTPTSDLTIWRDRLNEYLSHIGSASRMVMSSDPQFDPYLNVVFEARRSAEWTGPVDDVYYFPSVYQRGRKRAHPDMLPASGESGYWTPDTVREFSWNAGLDSIYQFSDTDLESITDSVFTNSDATTHRRLLYMARRGREIQDTVESGYTRTIADGFEFLRSATAGFAEIDDVPSRTLIPRAIHERIGAGKVNLFVQGDLQFGRDWILSQLPSMFADARTHLDNFNITVPFNGSAAAVHSIPGLGGGSRPWNLSTTLNMINCWLFEYSQPITIANGNVSTTPVEGVWGAYNANGWTMDTPVQPSGAPAEHPGVTVTMRYVWPVVDPHGIGSEPDLMYKRNGDLDVFALFDNNWGYYIDQEWYESGDAKTFYQSAWDIVKAEHDVVPFIQADRIAPIETWLAATPGSTTESDDIFYTSLIRGYYSRPIRQIEVGLTDDGSYQIEAFYLADYSFTYLEVDSETERRLLPPVALIYQDGTFYEYTGEPERIDWRDEPTFGGVINSGSDQQATRWELANFEGVDASIETGKPFSVYLRYETGAIPWDDSSTFVYPNQNKGAKLTWRHPLGVGVGTSNTDVDYSLRLALVVESSTDPWFVGQSLEVTFQWENDSADEITNIRVISASPDFPAALGVADITLAALSSSTTTADYVVTQADIDAGGIVFDVRGQGAKGVDIVEATATKFVEDSDAAPPPPPP